MRDYSIVYTLPNGKNQFDIPYVHGLEAKIDIHGSLVFYSDLSRSGIAKKWFTWGSWVGFVDQDHDYFHTKIDEINDDVIFNLKDRQVYSIVALAKDGTLVMRAKILADSFNIRYRPSDQQYVEFYEKGKLVAAFVGPVIVDIEKAKGEIDPEWESRLELQIRRKKASLSIDEMRDESINMVDKP